MPHAFYLSYAALWILVIAQGLILLGVVRLVYQIQHPAVGDGQLRRGQRAPQFNALDLAGAPITSADFAGRVTALLFVSPKCPSCAATLAELDALRHKAQGNLAVICQANHEDCTRLVERYGFSVPAVADEDDRISRLFGVSTTPMAVLIDEQGRIQAQGQPMRGAELEEMFERAPEAAAQGVD